MRKSSRTHARLASDSVNDDTEGELSNNDTGEDQAAGIFSGDHWDHSLKTDDAGAKFDQLGAQLMPRTTHRTGYHRFSDRYLGKPAELYTGLILQKPGQHEISSDRRKHQNEVLTLTYPSEKSAAPHAKMVLSDRAVEASVSPHLPFGGMSWARCEETYAIFPRPGVFSWKLDILEARAGTRST